MSKMLFDAVDIKGARITNDGYLVGEARVARIGIQLYTAGELGLDGDAARVIRVYRPPEEVFAADAMSSFAHRPVTIDHPNELVDASNWKKFAKGQTGDEVLRDGEFIRVPLVLMDAGAIREFSDGKRELSMGYTMDLEVVDGTTPEGESYHAIQRNLRMNHLALVSRARGGSDLRLGDDNVEGSIMSEVKLTTVTVDGLSVETTDAGAQAISKLQTDLATAQTALVEAETAHDKALAAKDTDLAKKDATIDELNGKLLSDEDLDKRVNDRADLIAKAKTIADKDYSGKSDVEIRTIAVVAKLGQDAVDGKSADYILARFDILVDDAKTGDPVRDALRHGTQQPGNLVTDAYDKMVGDLGNAWKGKGNQQEVNRA